MAESRYKALADCSRFDDDLGAYLEGEARPFIISHAHDCASCATLLADLQSIRQAARDLPQEEPSPALWNKVRSRLEAEGAFSLSPCLRFGEELEAYMEGEARPFIVSHAGDCDSCAFLLADLQSIRQAAPELPQAEPSPALWNRVRARLEAEGAFSLSPCLRFGEELEAHLEGEARPFILSHSQDCASCALLLSDLQSIREAARNLPQEEPSRVVWANVRAQLEAEGAFSPQVSIWRQLLAWPIVPHLVPLGALATLVILGSVLSLPSNNVRRWAPADDAAASSTVAQIASVIPAGEPRALAHVVSDLESSFRANEASMAPDLKATYEKSLVSLDGSIQECLDSLRHEPKNTLAQDYLLTAYSRKAEILSSALEFNGR